MFCFLQFAYLEYVNLHNLFQLGMQNMNILFCENYCLLIFFPNFKDYKLYLFQ